MSCFYKKDSTVLKLHSLGVGATVRLLIIMADDLHQDRRTHLHRVEDARGPGTLVDQHSGKGRYLKPVVEVARSRRFKTLLPASIGE